MKPWAIGKIYRSGAYVVAGPVGMIDASGTAVGDQVRINVDRYSESENWFD